MCVAAAAAGVAGVAGIAGSSIAASGAKSAANTQAQAADNAAQLQWQQFQQLQQNQQPYMELGQNTIPWLQGQLTGLNNQSFNYQPFNFNPTQQQLEQTPGYQFTLQQGMKNTNNALAAKGLNLSGAQAKGLADYTTGLASNTYQQQYQNALNTYNTNYNNALNNFRTNYGTQSDQYNRLAGLVGLGQNAAAGVGNSGLQTASNVGNLITSGANAQAAGTVGAANAINQGLGSLGSNGLLYSLMRNQGGGASSPFSSGIYGSSGYDTSFDNPSNYG